MNSQFESKFILPKIPQEAGLEAIALRAQEQVLAQEKFMEQELVDNCKFVQTSVISILSRKADHHWPVHFIPKRKSCVAVSNQEKLCAVISKNFEEFDVTIIFGEDFVYQDSNYISEIRIEPKKK